MAQTQNRSFSIRSWVQCSASGRPRVPRRSKMAQTKRHGSKAGYSSGVVGVDTRRATPQIRGLRAGGSLAVASSIPATQLSSPARLAERVVTLRAPMTNDVGGQPRFPGARKGVTLPLLVISGLATGPPAEVGDRLRFLSPR